MDTTVRCFARSDRGKLRRGIWVMTGQSRGVFLHGDRNEMQAPEWDIDTLENQGTWISELSPEEVLEELKEWPEGMEFVKRTFDRHPKDDRYAPHQARRGSDVVLDAVVRQALADRIRKDIANIGCIYGTVGAALWEEPVERLVCRILASVEAILPNSVVEPTSIQRKDGEA